MAYSGKFRPSNPKKYRGNPTRIIYRSMWEKKFMIFCDRTRSIVEWGSEEIIIPYRCPTDGKVHRYYPDFYIKVLNNCLLYTSPSPRDQSGSRMPSSA